MTRYIDADALEPLFYEHLDDNAMAGAMNAIEDALTIDAVEVVRCKDCRYQVHCYQTVSHNKIHDGFKEYWSEPIEFCSKGKRREE